MLGQKLAGNQSLMTSMIVCISFSFQAKPFFFNIHVGFVTLFDLSGYDW
jgi:hypothetical protein